MEQKLAEYRARKAKEHESLRSKEYHRGSGVLSFFRREQKLEEPKTVLSSFDEDQPSPSNKTLDKTANLPTDPIPKYEFPLTREEKVYRAASLTLKVILWVILWALFIEIGFGAVYFIVSTLFIIYWNMRAGSRDKTKLSAYSVFNPNFERLEGTFTAEQFEKELRYGAGSVR